MRRATSLPGGGDSGEEEVEASVKFADPVVVGEVAGQAPHDRELARRQLVEPEAEEVGP